MLEEISVKSTNFYYFPTLCGKTTLAKRFMTNKFISDTQMTIGVDLQVKVVKVGDTNVKLQIWDFGGEERFRFFLPRYVKGAHGGLFMYDITNLESTLHINEWLTVIRETSASFPIMLIGGKSDLEDYREVTIEEGKKLAKEYELDAFLESSSKTGHNVEKIFKDLTRIMLESNKNSWI
jgi:small GTP-binding protein